MRSPESSSSRDLLGKYIGDTEGGAGLTGDSQNEGDDRFPHVEPFTVSIEDLSEREWERIINEGEHVESVQAGQKRKLGVSGDDLAEIQREEEEGVTRVHNEVNDYWEAEAARIARENVREGAQAVRIDDAAEVDVHAPIIDKSNPLYYRDNKGLIEAGKKQWEYKPSFGRQGSD